MVATYVSCTLSYRSPTVVTTRCDLRIRYHAQCEHRDMMRIHPAVPKRLLSNRYFDPIWVLRLAYDFTIQAQASEGWPKRKKSAIHQISP